jgi:hypothetical protein
MKKTSAGTAALVWALLGALAILVSCSRQHQAPEEVQRAGSAQRSADCSIQPNPERNAYFGDEHIHTGWSLDAWIIGNRITGPADALHYAQGQTIKHPLGYDITIDTPLDWMGVTDHSEYVGVIKQVNTPTVGFWLQTGVYQDFYQD